MKVTILYFIVDNETHKFIVLDNIQENLIDSPNQYITDTKILSTPWTDSSIVTSDSKITFLTSTKY